MSIDEHGFLSEDLVHIQKQIRERHATRFDLIHRVNTFCQQGKYKLSVHNRDGQQVLAVCVLLKLLNDVQAAVLLLERGLASPARSLLRVGIDALFILANICEHADFYGSFILGSKLDRLKLLRAIQKSSAPVFNDVRPYASPELIEKLTNEIKEAGTTKETAEKLAQQVNLGPLYDGAYRLLSQDVHTSPRALERYLDLDEARKLKGFAWGPETEDLALELNTAAELMILGFGAVDQLFGLNLRPELGRLDAELRALIGNPPEGIRTDSGTPL